MRGPALQAWIHSMPKLNLGPRLCPPHCFTPIKNCQVVPIVHFLAVEKPNQVSDLGPITERMICCLIKRWPFFFFRLSILSSLCLPSSWFVFLKKTKNKTKQNKRTTWKILKHVSALMTRDWNIYQHAIKWFDRDNLSPAWPRWEHSKTNFSCF